MKKIAIALIIFYLVGCATKTRKPQLETHDHSKEKKGDWIHYGDNDSIWGSYSNGSLGVYSEKDSAVIYFCSRCGKQLNYK